MTVKAKLHKGLQSRSQTSIDGNFKIEKSGTTITVRAGTFIDVQGNEYSVPETTKDIGVSSNKREVGIYLVGSQGSEKVVFDVYTGGDPVNHPEDLIMPFVQPNWFHIPAGVSDLSNIDMYAFGWIDSHPKEVHKELPDSAEAVRHEDLQKLKRDGFELELEDAPDIAVQTPSNPSDKQSVRSV